jgi:hypothetical protein
MKGEEGTKATAVTELISVIEPPEWLETNCSFACFRRVRWDIGGLWEDGGGSSGTVVDRDVFRIGGFRSSR